MSTMRPPFRQRHVIRGWLRKRVVLQVMDTSGSKWRDAKVRDLTNILEENIRWNQRRCSDRKLTIGTGVRANVNSGFHRGATGRVVFQTPAGGQVWVVRDGTDEPCYFWNDELDILEA